MTSGWSVRDGGLRPRLMALLSVLAVVGPVSMELYLPTLPEVARDLDLSPAEQSWSLLGCLGGLAVGQVAWGPIADRVGRRRAVLAGLAIWILATTGCALVTGATQFLALRVVQGLAGAAGLTVSRAVLADLLPGDRLQRPLARLMILTAAFTVLSPVIGGVLLTVVEWRGVFWILVVGGAVTLVWTTALLPESRPSRARDGDREPITFGPGFGLAVLTAGLAFATIIVYVTSSPAVLRGRYGLDSLTFGVVFAVTALAMTVGAQSSPRLAARIGADRTVLVALGASLVTGLLLVAAAGLSADHLPPLPVMVVLVVLTNGATGAAMPIAAAQALAGVTGRAGTASGVVGGVQFGLGALVSAALIPWHPDDVAPMALAMCGSILATLATWSFRLRGAPVVKEVPVTVQRQT